MAAIRHIALLGTLLLILSGVVVSIAVTALPAPNPELKQEIDNTWYLSEPFTLTDNISFSVIVQSVEFEFLHYYIERRMTDIPTTLFFVVQFSDGVTEYIASEVGGFILLDHRLVTTEHTGPQAAIVSGYGDSEDERNGWYYAVSPDATTTVDETYSALYYTIAGLAWVIALSFIAYDYRKRTVSGNS